MDPVLFQCSRTKVRRLEGSRRGLSKGVTAGDAYDVGLLIDHFDMLC